MHPVILKKSSISNYEPRRVRPEVECPSPSKMNRIRSQVQIELVPDSPVKKYKKGYLAYQLNGDNIWSEIKSYIE